MRAYRAAAVAVLLAASACTSATTTGDAPNTPPPSSTAASAPSSVAKLAPVWTPKLEGLDVDATSMCAQAADAGCGIYIDSIMGNVEEISDAIEKAGVEKYPATTKQLDEMWKQHQDYIGLGCTNGTASESDCSGPALAITIGVATLSIALATNEVSM